MRILVIGGGGRESALVWKLAQSPNTDRLYCAPGNAGTSRLAESINLKSSDIDGLANFAAVQKIGLTVVGPEAPLIDGIVDRFEARGLPIFGPSTDPARLEGSKSFSKDLMLRYGIPTAEHWSCANPGDAHAHATAYFDIHKEQNKKLVIKADGIAAGKGVVIVESEEEAHRVIDEMMLKRIFGEAGDQIILEECLEGEEVSIMAFTDGYTVVPMPPSQDHKRIFDNDAGPNTGGMGAYSPVPVVPEDIVELAMEKVLQPAVNAIRDLGIPYKGVLYAGLMLTNAGPKTLEFNCRFGDPETQAVLPLLDTDIVELMDACVNSSLDNIEVKWKQEASATIVASSGGYPGQYSTGKLIEGIDKASRSEGCTVFQAGTRLENGQVLTDGGRVLAVTGIGPTLKEAVARAYTGIGHIQFEGMHYRHDIAARALKS